MAAAPERTCFGCGRKAAKTEFIRLALLDSGQVRIDPGQRAGGRGLYLCPRAECFGRAGKRKLPEPMRRRQSGPGLAELLARTGEDLRENPKGVY